jgi:hypothetical protein
MSMSIHIMERDWKEDLDIGKLNEAVEKVSGGTCHIYEPADTGFNDHRVVIVSAGELTEQEVQQVYDACYAKE